MTARPPRLRVRVDRVILYGVQPVGPDELAAAIEGALGDALAGAPPVRPSATPAPAAEQVGRAVAPAVLSAAGLGPEGGPRP